MENVISSNKLNEITYAIGQLQDLGIVNAHERVYSRYPTEVVTGYKSQCAEMDARDHSTTAEGSY
jgi:hypothetical protein